MPAIFTSPNCYDRYDITRKSVPYVELCAVKQKNLDMYKLVFASKHISTDEAMRNIEPFELDDAVINGDRKVVFLP